MNAGDFAARASRPCRADKGTGKMPVLQGVSLLLAFLCILTIHAEPYAWKNVAIVGGGFVTGLITHPTEKGLIYARTDVGGAYRWDVRQDRWIPLTDWIDKDHWSDMGVESIAIDPSDPDRVYLAVGTYVTNWSPTNGAILRSDDRGKTWKRTDLPFHNGGNEPGRSMGERLAVDPSDGNVMFFGTRGAGLWKSSDRGQRWAKVPSFPDIATSDSASSGGKWSRPLGIAFVQCDPQHHVIYAGVATREASLYRSTDRGETWGAIEHQPTGLRPNHGALSLDGSLYISYGDDPGPNTMTDGALWKLDSTNGAWTDVTPEKPTADRKFGYGSVSVDARHPQTIMTSSFNRWNGDDQIYRSTDGGKNWRTLREHAVLDWSAAPWLTWGKPSLRMGHWIGDLEIDPTDSDHVLYVTGWGVWESRDATQVDTDADSHWRFTRGIEECVLNNVISPPSGAPLLSVMWDIDGFRHEKLDVSPPQGFFLPQVGRNTDIDFAQNDPNQVVRVFTGQTGGAVSTDSGNTWSVFGAAPTEDRGGAVAISADGSSIVWTPENSASYVSNDRGSTWKLCEGIAAKVRVASDRVDARFFYAVDSSGNVLVSTNGAQNFVSRHCDALLSNGFVRASPDAAGEVWIASANGLWRSTNAGSSVTPIPAIDSAFRIGFGKPAPHQSFSAVYLIGKIAGVYGFFRSEDQGQSWLRINDDQHQFGGVTCLTGDPRVFGRVYVGSSNRGILYGEPSP